MPTAPTITYISRQGYGRSLRPADHDALVEALEKLVERKGWILETPQMEKLSYDEQLALAARTDVLLGVHGSQSGPISSFLFSLAVPRSPC